MITGEDFVRSTGERATVDDDRLVLSVDVQAARDRVDVATTGVAVEQIQDGRVPLFECLFKRGHLTTIPHVLGIWVCPCRLVADRGTGWGEPSK